MRGGTLTKNPEGEKKINSLHPRKGEGEEETLSQRPEFGSWEEWGSGSGRKGVIKGKTVGPSKSPGNGKGSRQTSIRLVGKNRPVVPGEIPGEKKLHKYLGRLRTKMAAVHEGGNAPKKDPLHPEDGGIGETNRTVRFSE